MPEERNRPSTRLLRCSEIKVVASSSGLKVVRLRLIAQLVKQYLQAKRQALVCKTWFVATLQFGD